MRNGSCHRRATGLRRRSLAPALLLAAVALLPGEGWAQRITFESELPRTLVFVEEDGGAQTATANIADFLRQAGFPLIDPALARTAAQADLVKKAAGGDEFAAVRLGRDLGAQMVVLGHADWGARPDPLDGSAITGTADLSVRVLRMDNGEVVASGRGDGRNLEATEQAARTAAIGSAARKVLTESAFLGAIMNDWAATPWTDGAYFPADPGSVGAALGATTASEAPQLAILNTDVAPPEEGGPATRGIGVVQRSRGGAEVVNHVAIDGIVMGRADVVEVEGVRAQLTPLSAAEQRRLGVGADARRFTGRTSLPLSRDTVRVVARGPGGETTQVIAAPRIDKRWAVIVGISDYASADIPDLGYASKDAQAFHDFLRSDAAGPFEEENILLLKDADATGQALREAMFVFLQQADWDDLVVIYFAGHGAPDPSRPDNLYLLPTDADVNALAATGFPMWDVKTALRRQISAERVVVIADACHSGGTGEGAEGPNPISSSFADLFSPSRRLTLTAADSNELSYEDERWGGGHGVFTHALLRGLAGEADGDGNGIVTFSEVAEFVASSVASETAGKQNPQRTGLGDVPLAVVPASGTVSTGDGR
ncbi:MAG TPA: caspase family protein [Longimicrobiales bacterium]|nr:caspase family protein [Longimicrobiales bacterium]